MIASRVAITGTTGYLGSVLSDHFSSRGDQVVALSVGAQNTRSASGVTSNSIDPLTRIFSKAWTR